MYNREFGPDAETRLQTLRLATTFYQGTALCTDHWERMVEKSLVKAEQDGHRSQSMKDLDLLHLGD